VLVVIVLRQAGWLNYLNSGVAELSEHLSRALAEIVEHRHR
jgi:hypothetical protein